MPPNQIDPVTVAAKAPFLNTTITPEVIVPELNRTKIQQFYKDARIFITGGTGFLGKILIEKLLRSCPDIQCLYILIRDKKGKNIHSRIADVFDDPIFELLHKEQPKFQHKVVTIFGDCSLPKLGMSQSDIDLLQRECTVVFHVAATVRFDEKMRLATAINITSPRDLIEISKKMNNLKSFVHVSTAYANCPENVIEERFYEAPIDSDRLIKLLEALDDKVIEKITPTILGKWPNTYAFTKAVAEDVVRKEGVVLPIGVFRPAIVISSYKEPIQGWIDNMYGPTGVSAAAANGVMRTLHCDPSAIANIVPVDTCVNALIVSAHDVYRKHLDHLRNQTVKTSDDIPLYNYVSSVENPITWKTFMDLNHRYGINYPSIRAIYYYDLTLNKSYPIHLLYLIFLHYLPAFLLDTACVVVGKEARYLKMYGKIHTFMKVISYFATRTWTFTNNNVQALLKTIDKDDQELFEFDMNELHWEEFFKKYMMGIRVYLLKDPLTTIPAALQRWNRLYYVHQTLRIITGLVTVTVLWTVFSTIF